MVCPYCGSNSILHSDYFALHIIRVLYNSRKRYCVSCGKKWRLKSRKRDTIIRDLILFAVTSVAALVLLHGINSVDMQKVKSDMAAPPAMMAASMLINHKMNSSGRGGGAVGTGGGLASLSNLSDSEKKQLKQMMGTYGGKKS